MSQQEEAIELLKEDFKLGVYSKEEYEAELLKLGVNVNQETTPDYLLVGTEKDSRIKVFKHIDSIRTNIKPIAKMILENKWGQKDIKDDKIIVVGGEYNDCYSVHSITYINKFGAFISIHLEDVVSYLDKIDFDE